MRYRLAPWTKLANLTQLDWQVSSMGGSQHGTVTLSFSILPDVSDESLTVAASSWKVTQAVSSRFTIGVRLTN
jgi:hypothetical protein